LGSPGSKPGKSGVLTPSSKLHNYKNCQQADRRESENTSGPRKKIGSSLKRPRLVKKKTCRGGGSSGPGDEQFKPGRHDRKPREIKTRQGEQPTKKEKDVRTIKINIETFQRFTVPPLKHPSKKKKNAGDLDSPVRKGPGGARYLPG